MNKLKIALILSMSVLSTTAFAGACDVAIESTAAMAFNAKEIAVPKTCKEITITLKNTGTMAKNIMGHNLVITKTSDMKAVLEDGNTAGLASNYVKAKDNRVVAYTNVIGGGETATVKFKTKGIDAKTEYMYFCSFPGHSSMMKGIFKLI